MMNLHYDLTTGEIVSWGDHSHGVKHGAESHLSGCAVAVLAAAIAIDPKSHRVDLASRKVVAKNAAEKAHALLPTLREIKGAAVRELEATDALMVHDRPMTDAERQAWQDYRRALRDVSKVAGGAVEMARAFPRRPGDTDAISHLRARD